MTLEFSKEFLIQPKSGGDTPSPTPSTGLLLSAGQPVLMNNELENETEGYVTQNKYVFNSTDDSVSIENFITIGTLTIEDDWMSGFSLNTNYATIPNAFSPSNNPWEMLIEFKTTSISPDWQPIMDSTASEKTGVLIAIRKISNSQVNLWISLGNGSSWLVDRQGTTNLQANTTYWLKFVFTGTSYILYLSTTGEFNGEETTEFTINTAYSIAQGTTLTLGNSNRTSQVFEYGSINLKNSYIKINDTIWWQGFINDYSNYAYPDFISKMKGLYTSAVDYPVFTGVNGTRYNGTLTDKGEYTGGSDGYTNCYIVFADDVPLDTANTWEFQTKYTHVNTTGNAVIFSFSGSTDCQFPYFSVEGGKFRLMLSSNGSSWNINQSGVSSLEPLSNITYYLKVGFTGSEYYIDYNTNGSDNYTRIYSLQTSTKVYVGAKPALMGFTNNSNYYNRGTMDLTKTKFIINGETVYNIATFYNLKQNQGVKFYNIGTEDAYRLIYPELWGIDTANNRILTPSIDETKNIYYLVGKNYTSSSTIIY